MKRILVTGAAGQIGQELTERLAHNFGRENIVQGDLKFRDAASGVRQVAFDVREKGLFEEVINEFDIGTVYHLASLLSAKGEAYPDLSWEVNLEGLKTVLDLARTYGLVIFWPSSIAVFGPTTPKDNTPQSTILEPATIYGVTKLAGEHLCRYYHQRYDVDVRSVRFPGLISYAAPPGGGTTDFSIDMLKAAAKGIDYSCFLSPKTRLPMMYMPDALKAIEQLMRAPGEDIRIRSSYNLTAFSFSAEELMTEIQKHVPEFNCTFEPDHRQEIADSWPRSIDDNEARKDWNWKPNYDLSQMVVDMLEKAG